MSEICEVRHSGLSRRARARLREVVRHVVPEADGRGQYPDLLQFRVPRDYRDRIRHQAQERGVTMSDFVRDALAEKIEAPSRCPSIDVG